MRSTRDAVLVRQLRAALVGLAAATCLGAFVELAMLRHWKGTEQLIPWVILGVLAVGIVTFWVRRDSPIVVLGVRVLAVIAALGSGFGVLEHVKSNWETAPLSAKFATTWDTIPALQQWWLAATGGAGATPPLAPGFVGLSGICLALATLGLYQRRR